MAPKAHSKFGGPWSYLICFKSEESRASWYDTPAAISIKLHQRVYPTRSGKPNLLYFDAATMSEYQLPPKVDEITYCRRAARPFECKKQYNGINPRLVNPITQLGGHKDAPNKYSAVQLGLPVYNSPVIERHLREISTSI